MKTPWNKMLEDWTSRLPNWRSFQNDIANTQTFLNGFTGTVPRSENEKKMFENQLTYAKISSKLYRCCLPICNKILYTLPNWLYVKQIAIYSMHINPTAYKNPIKTQLLITSYQNDCFHFHYVSLSFLPS